MPARPAGLAPPARRPSRLRARAGRLLAGLAVAALLLAGAVPARAEPVLPRGVWPVAGAAVVAEFDPPDVPWGAGHRGLDLAAAPGTPVVAAAAGTVTHAGALAGRGVVVLDHGSVRTTYEPVEATVRVGDRVATGAPLGRVGVGGHCSGSCLHWGLRAGDTYLDPRLLLGATIRLMAEGERPAPPPATAAAAAAAGPVPGAATTTTSGLVRPSAGAVTSRFGWRVHPVLGTRRFHDGVDLGAGCGTPIRAVAAGVVVQQVRHPAYGLRLVVDHGTVGGHRVVASYNHATSWAVSVGDTVTAGQVVGAVGSTGWSTGCHLHFSVWRDGTLVDPEPLL